MTVQASFYASELGRIVLGSRAPLTWGLDPTELRSNREFDPVQAVGLHLFTWTE